MRTVIVFAVLLVLCLGVVLCVHASKKPKTVWDGPYNASCVAEIHGASMSGWARVRGTGAVRNGSYMCSMGTLNTPNTPDSGANINGSFTGYADYFGSNQGSIYADASAWGSNRHGEWYSVSVSDSDS